MPLRWGDPAPPPTSGGGGDAILSDLFLWGEKWQRESYVLFLRLVRVQHHSIYYSRWAKSTICIFFNYIIIFKLATTATR